MKTLFHLLIGLGIVLTSVPNTLAQPAWADEVAQRVGFADAEDLQHVGQAVISKLGRRLREHSLDTFAKLQSLSYSDLEALMSTAQHLLWQADDILGLSDSEWFQAVVERTRQKLVAASGLEPLT